MENIPRNLEKDLIPPTPGQDKNKRSWQILFIDDHGRIIPVKQFKVIALALISLLAASMILAITFFILFMNNRGSASSTRDKIAHYKSQIKSLQNEVDIQTARVVLLTESMNKNDVLVLYQHRFWPKEGEWQEIRKKEFAECCGVDTGNIKMWSAKQIADDVVFYFAEK